MAAAAVMNCYLVNLDHPRSFLHGLKFVLKFHFTRTTTFLPRNGHLKILQIWLKTTIPAPQICVFGVLLLYIIFRHRDPPKGTFLRETTSFEPSCVKIGSSIFTARQHSLLCTAERCISHDRFCLTVRTSDRPPHASIMPKRLQLRSWGLHCRIASSL